MFLPSIRSQYAPHLTHTWILELDDGTLLILTPEVAQ